MPKTSDPMLNSTIERCKAGDEDAFRIIVDEYRDRLFRVAYLITRDASRADDATQEALLLAWRDMKRLRNGSSLSAWLNRILVNQIYRQTRRKQHQIEPIDFALELPSPDSGPDEAIAQTESFASLRSAIQTLSEDHRTAIVLRFYLEYSVREIAEATGWTEGTVKSRLSRAISSLRGTMTANLAPTGITKGETA